MTRRGWFGALLAALGLRRYPAPARAPWQWTSSYTISNSGVIYAAQVYAATIRAPEAAHA